MCKRVFDETIELADNAMLKVRPELFDEWDFIKNDELGIDVCSVTKGMKKNVWWECKDCDSPWYMKIIDRGKPKESNCPFCSGKRANHTNSLASLNPKLASQWHPVLNNNLTSHDVTCGSKKKVWWIGKCGHTWDARIADRTIKNSGCPYCNNKKVLIGFNDMWTTNPELASLLNDSNDGYKHTQKSGKRVTWKCDCCGEIIKDKRISKTYYLGISCPKCSDGKPYPEKFMYNALKSCNAEFEWEKIFEWSHGKRYDFYLPYCKMIIEVHGKQHYNCGFEKAGGKNLKEVQENDKYKYELAMQNGIEYYIVIDAQESKMDYIKNSITKSKLRNFMNVDGISWNSVHENSLKSLVIEVCETWTKGHDMKHIINETKLSKSTVRKYLNNGAKIGLCNYCGETELRKNRKSQKENVQLTSNNEMIRVWENMRKASQETGIGYDLIRENCKGNRKTAGGFIWMYKEDYEKQLAEQNKLDSLYI